MRHVGLKARMAFVGSVLFAFYALVAIIAVQVYGVGLPVVFLGTIAFAGFQYKFGKWAAIRSSGAEDMDEAFLREVAPNVTDAMDRIRKWLGEE
jgi:heat shock protein HtpX